MQWTLTRGTCLCTSASTAPAPERPLESVDVRQIYDKFPEKKGGLRELYDRGPPTPFSWSSSGRT